MPLPDRGFDYGDGLFETLLLHYGRPLFTELHMERMAHGLRALALPDCLEAARQQMDRAARFAAQKNWPWSALRLSITRGSGPRGYAPAIASKPRIVIYVSCLDRDCGKMDSGANLILADIRLSHQPLLAHIKHLNRLEQILAAAQTQAKYADECLMLDQNEHLTSVAAGNLFLVCQGELLTPELVGCGVLGTRRRLIMESWAPSIGLNVRKARLKLSDLQSAEEVFYSNSLFTVRPVVRVGEQFWNNDSVCNALFQRYLQGLQ
jgi:4-amino-4-deoxychorismate lyase